MRHLVLRSLLITPVLALIAFAQGAVSPALGACGVPDPTKVCGRISGPCDCGYTVLESTTLKASRDPILRPGRLCPGDGLFVASGVTLQISGTIRSTPPISGNSCSGIVVVPSATKVVVKIGQIVGFNFGVEAGAMVTESQFSRLRIRDSTDTGIRLASGGNKNVIEKNIIKGDSFVAGIDVRDGVETTVRLNNVEIQGDGIRVQGGRKNIVSKNLSTQNQSFSSGFLVSGDCATVHSNQSLDNTVYGFGITGTNHTVTNNVANDNDDFGITTDPQLIGESCISCRFADNQCANNDFLPSGPGQSSPPGLCNAPPTGMVPPGAC